MRPSSSGRGPCVRIMVMGGGPAVDVAVLGCDAMFRRRS